MVSLKKIMKYILDSNYRFIINEGLGLYKNVSDVKFTKKKFFVRMGYELDLENPTTFNQKLQWLKLYDHNPQYTQMVDKLGAKEYVKGIIGEQYIIPTIGVWERAEDIDWETLPNQFVLKVTHDSGGIIVCRDKSRLDKNEATKKLRKSLKTDYYSIHREWPYKDVPRRVIVEKYMVDNSSKELRDYKLFCFYGEPRITLVCSDRFSKTGLCEDFFDENWCHLPVKRPNIPSSAICTERPMNFELMKEFAKQLSKDIPFVRIDFYEINGKVYFGEITLYPAAGFSGFVPEEWDQKLGEWIELSKSTVAVNLDKMIT